MFGFLKKQLKKGVEKLTKKIEEPEEPKPRLKAKAAAKERPKKTIAKMPPSERPIEVSEEKPVVRKVDVSEGIEEKSDDLGWLEEHAPPSEDKKGFLSRLMVKITEKTLTDADIDEFFDESEPELLQNNVALEVSEFLKDELKKKLVEKPIKRSQAEGFITNAFEESILDVVNQGELDIEQRIKEAKKEGRPLCIVFLGFNGSGKTTSIAKMARYLTGKKHGVVLAAGDTFRAASIEQLDLQASKLGVDIVKHKYGADAAAVIFDAVQHAKSKGLDVVLADTAGRTHTDKNLMEELKKLIRVNKPDLKILVVDSLTGNDAVEQAKQFNEAVGVDAVFMTKVDVNEKGGSILSVCYAIKKPILFICVGQGYDDIKLFKPKDFVKGLLE